jgi:hypothetical protein
VSEYLHHLDGVLGAGIVAGSAFAVCSVLDTLNGTAPWSQTKLGKRFNMVTDENGSTSDYWDGVTSAIAEAFAVTHSDEELELLLTDEELSRLSEDVDSIPADDWDDAIADDTIRAEF